MQTEGPRGARVQLFQCMNCHFYTAVRDDPRMSIELDNLPSGRLPVMPCKHCGGLHHHRVLMASESDFEKVAEDQSKPKK